MLFHGLGRTEVLQYDAASTQIRFTLPIPSQQARQRRHHEGLGCGAERDLDNDSIA